MRTGVVRTSVGPRFARIEGGDSGQVAHLLDGAPWLGGKETGETAKADGNLLCPVAPSKIVCIGRNYAAHAKEMGAEAPAEPCCF